MSARTQRRKQRRHPRILRATLIPPNSYAVIECACPSYIENRPDVAVIEIHHHDDCRVLHRLRGRR